MLLARGIVRSVPLEIVGGSGHEKVPTSGKPDTLQQQILNPSALSVHSLKHWNIGNCVYSGAKPDQCGMTQIGKRSGLLMNPGLFGGTDDNRVRVWRHPAYDRGSTLIVMRGTLTGQRYVDDILRPHVGPFLMVSQGQFSSKKMLVRIQQELLKSSYVIFRFFHGQPTPPICPL
ncbi:hypothetical protein TNCV_2134281 [Trichonephila clavipes]|nr:hypothetical protein TNCV_2134281 [Trichonephila clavipes]